MDTAQAFMNGDANRGKELMVFDWDKAAKIIKERNAQTASAGLSNDWEWTGGKILEKGKPFKDDYTYLASTWAIPELEIDGETVECYQMQSKLPTWGKSTKWPPSALTILEGRKS